MSNPQFDEECRKAAGESSADDKDKRIAELEMNGLLAFLEIRKANGDPEGRLMQDQVVERVRDAFDVLRGNAKQKLSSELDEEQSESADFETAYDMFVSEARDIINPPTP